MDIKSNKVRKLARKEIGEHR